MKKMLIILLILPVIAWGEPTIYEGTITGDVEPAMAAYVKRMLEQVDQPDAILILKMDTFGGRVDAAFDIVDELTNTQYVTTIAYVTNQAISAGALIALACDQLYMKPHTTIGDCAPITYDSDGPQMLGEKFQSPLRAKFRTLAKKNGYPSLLAEAMVSSEKAVYEVIDASMNVRYMDRHAYDDLTEAEKKACRKRTIVPKGELLTMDDTEAHDLGFSKKTASKIEDIQADLSMENLNIVPIEETWSEQLVRAIYSVSSILLLIGMAALYMELKSPGFGVFGIIGIIFLGIVFFAQYFVGLSDHVELLLIALGVVLMGFEMFVFPGFGVSGLLAIGCIAIALILSFQGFVIPSPDMPWETQLMVNNSIKVLGSAVLSWLLAIVLFRFVVPKTAHMVSGPYLHTNLEKAHVADETNLDIQTGSIGVARTPLRPSGKMAVGKHIYDVLTQGEFIPQGAEIKVITTKGAKVIVKPL